MLLLGVTVLIGCAAAQNAGPNNKLEQAHQALANAQRLENESEVKRQATLITALLGDAAGQPEVPDAFERIPADATALSSSELTTAFDPYIARIEAQTWWRIGLDPTRTNHAPREVADVIEGCLAARTVSKQTDQLLRMARAAGDYLIWTQQQGGTGVIPFPAVRNGTGKAFETAEAFYRRAERAGRLEEVIQNGWAIEDFGDGGLQFDHGLAGVALVHLFEVTQDQAYKNAALWAADWAVKRSSVPNWNYNSFSVQLLAEAYRITGKGVYLEAAKQKIRLGVLPGQLITGPRAGRWADPHNARPVYHYILVSGLAALVTVLPENDVDLPIVLESLRLALKVRNPDYRQGVSNPDSVLEALLRVQALPKRVGVTLEGLGTPEALENLKRYTAAGFRAGSLAIGPGSRGQLLAYAATRK